MAPRKNLKYNPTNGHFVRKQPDRVRTASEKVPIPPLYKNHLAPYCWDAPQPSRVASYENSVPVYRAMPPEYRLFFDTGFLTSHEIPQDFWESLTSKQIFITTEVWKELRFWIEKPRCNKWFRDYLIEAVKCEEAGISHPYVSIASINDFPSGMNDVAKYYVNLLRMRKFFGIHRYEQFVNEHSREPTPSEIQAICEKFAGARGWRIAKKAIDERDKFHIVTDEALVVNAVFHSILFGSPVILFTRDNDVFDQFYKLIYLIDTHYVSMLMAENYHSSPAKFSAIPAPMAENPIYEGNGNVFLSMSNEVETLRPSDVYPIQCSCGLFSTSDKPLMHSSRTFGIVQDMERIIQMKQETRGRNTNLFGEMNFHVELDPRRVMFGESGPGLVNEKYLLAKSTDDFPISISDSELAVFTNEGFSTEQYEYFRDVSSKE